jgi:hypothetical protein
MAGLLARESAPSPPSQAHVEDMRPSGMKEVALRLQLRGQPRLRITHVPEKLFDFSDKDMRKDDPHRVPF